jgi:hypothetical protein
MHDLWPWLILFLLGCFHGINPGMGWLFAVALGMQEKSLRAVLGAVVPIGLGHAASIGIVVAAASLAQPHFSHSEIKFVAAGLLFAFGLYRLVRFRHPRWVGMRVGFWGLMLWAFIMATGHGAGLMLLPIVTAPLQMSNGSAGMTMMSAPNGGLLAVLVHTFGYLLMMTLVALVVYRWLGLSLLRSAWFNLDLLWAAALFVTGVVMLFV